MTKLKEVVEYCYFNIENSNLEGSLSILHQSGLDFGSIFGRIPYAGFRRNCIPSNVISTIYDPNHAPLLDVLAAIANTRHDTALSKAKDDVYLTHPLCCLYEREDQ